MKNKLVIAVVVVVAVGATILQVNLAGGPAWWYIDPVLRIIVDFAWAAVAVALVALTGALDGVAKGRLLPVFLVGLALVLGTALLGFLRMDVAVLKTTYAPLSLVVSALFSALYAAGAFLVALAGWGWLNRGSAVASQLDPGTAESGQSGRQE